MTVKTLKKRPVFLSIMTSVLLVTGGQVTAQEGQSDKTFELEAMTVTSEKREGNVQETSSSISVVGDVEIADYNLKSTRDLPNITPNFYITETGNSLMTNFAAIRGITGAMTGIPAVGFYVDDVYYSGLDINLLDVQRIEVLRGPQGTLYGRNSEAGIVNIVTRKPSNTWLTTAELDGGSYNSYGASVSTSGPAMSENLLIKAAVQYYETDSYFENKFDGSDDGGRHEDIDGRLSFLYTLSESLDLTLTYDLQRYDSPKNAQLAPLDEPGDLRKNINVDYAGESSKDTDGLSLRANYEMEGMNLVSITSGRSEDYFSGNDIDFMPIDLMTLKLGRDVSSFTEELRFVSKIDGPLQWITGLFILSEKDERKYDTWMNFMNMGMGVPGETLNQNSTTDTLAGALFGEATYTFQENLAVTMGLRYDHEKKDFDYTQTPGGFMLPMMGYAPESGSMDDTFDAWLPKFSINYQVMDQVNSYLTISRGFRSGGFNDKEKMGSSYKPEFTWNYEIGAKTTWLDNRLQLNAALFYIDWSDMQVEIATGGGASVYIDNAGKSTSKGAELELTARPTDGLEVIAGAGYTDATYDDYTRGTEVYDGKRIIDSPEYTLNFGATYRFAKGLFINGSYKHFGEIYYDPANTRSQEDYGLADAKVGYETEHFDVYLYANNIFDKEYATRGLDMQGTWIGRAGAPQTFGVTLTGRF